MAGPVEACLERLAAQEEAGINMHTVQVEANSPQAATAIFERLVTA
jgi:hypothetical protein